MLCFKDSESPLVRLEGPGAFRLRGAAEGGVELSGGSSAADVPTSEWRSCKAALPRGW